PIGTRASVAALLPRTRPAVRDWAVLSRGGAMNRLILLFAAVLALSAVPSRAQTGTVRGKAVDDKGAAVPDAKVAIEFRGGVKRNPETKTKKKGEFTQVGPQRGDYHITVSKEGFEPAVRDTKVGIGEPMSLPDFKLSPPKPKQVAVDIAPEVNKAV